MSSRVNKYLGYKEVTLRPDTTEKTTRYYIHHLMAYTFLGQRPKGYHIDHINRNREDNKIGNLRYIPSAENQSQGLCGKSKISKDGILSIYAKAWKLDSQIDLAKEYGCTPSMISRIKLGRQLSTITGHKKND